MSKIKVLDKGYIELIQHCGTESDIVNTARVSTGKNKPIENKVSDRFQTVFYCNTDKLELSMMEQDIEKKQKEEEDKKLFKFLVDKEHESPMEFTFLKFAVKAPIFVVRQWMRHRLCSYMEKSGRYNNLENVEFYIPSIENFNIDKNVIPYYDWNDDVEEHSKKSLELYNEMIKNGVKKEIARIILPLNMYTEFMFGCNLRSCLHFLKLRCESHAQWEIRQYANEILKIVEELYPNVIKFWKEKNKEIF